MRAIAMAAAALTALAGCDQANIGGKAQGGPTTNAGQAGVPAPVGKRGGAVQASADPGPGLGKEPAGAIQASASNGPGGGAVVDRTYLLGRWTDTGDCGNAVDFNSDGGFVAPDGTVGQWSLAGDRLTVNRERAPALTMQLVPIDQGRMSVVNPDGSLGESSRC